MFMSLLLLFSMLMMVCVFNPLQSLLWLMFNFMLGSLLMFEVGATFFALFLMLVYLGAIAVLFLFVVMLMNVRNLVNEFLFYDYIVYLGFLLFFLFSFWVNVYYSSYDWDTTNYGIWMKFFYKYNFLEGIGFLLYGFYFYYLIMMGFILLVGLLVAVCIVNLVWS